MTEAEWSNLWNTFVQAPAWTELDQVSQDVFRQAWYTRALPLFAQIIEAVGAFDRQQKAHRN